MTLTVATLDRVEDDEAWDAFVRSQPGWTHFHLAAWRHVLRDVHALEAPYLMARNDEGALAAVMPLVRVRSLVFGHHLVSLPFLNHGGPLGEVSAMQALVSRAVSMADRDGVDVLELRSRGPRPLSLPVSHRKVSVLLPLPDSAEALMKRFDGKLRSQVRRAGKEGATTAFGAAHLDAFFEVYARNMRDLGTPAQPLALFKRALAAFGDSMWIGAVYLAGVPVAAGAGFRWGDEFEMTWASSLRAYNRVAPNMLLYWAFMERCIAEGVRTFNFGRCTPGAGTHRFKRQWGGADETLWWYVHSRDGASAATPSAEHGRFALGPRVWQRMPTGLATALSPYIIRNIP